MNLGPTELVVMLLVSLVLTAALVGAIVGAITLLVVRGTRRRA